MSKNWQSQNLPAHYENGCHASCAPADRMSWDLKCKDYDPQLTLDGGRRLSRWRPSLIGGLQSVSGSAYSCPIGPVENLYFVARDTLLRPSRSAGTNITRNAEVIS